MNHPCDHLIAGVTHSHTMREPLPSRAAPIFALKPAGGCKDTSPGHTSPGIVVGFAFQP